MLKVHFAAIEDPNYAIQAKLGGAKYGLVTAYPFLRKANIKQEYILQYINEFCNNVIMDSGLFTLMFGAEKGNKSETFIRQWFDLLVHFIKINNFKGNPVEVDCQKVLSPEIAWELRTKMKDLLPDNEIINVIHLEDGNKGIDRLIEFSDYLAISVPELRAQKGIDARTTTYKMACYIKNKKPKIKIHLLGCTDLKIIKECSFCTSSDSTSWKQFARWGDATFMKNGTSVKGRYKADTTDIRPLVDYEASLFNKKTGEGIKNIICNGVIQVKEHIKLYSQYAGTQD